MLKKIAGVFVAVPLMAGSAFAALPTEVTTELADAKTDGVTVAVGIFLVVLAIAVWRHLRAAK